MIELRDGGLVVEVLEPVADAARLGSRYCSGGYVWQVTDERAGALCAGPAYPDPNPPPFDGQGLPEVFEIALGSARAGSGDDVHVLGVGRVRRESPVKPFHVRDNPNVVERLGWAVDIAGASLRAVARSAFDGCEYELTRTLVLAGRRLESRTSLRNVGGRDIPVRWFAHPFLPWPTAERAGKLVRFSAELAFPGDAPLVEDSRGFVGARAGVDWQRGHYTVPRSTLGARLEFEQRHPTCGAVVATCAFPLGWLALWGNARCFSVEPFFTTVVGAGTEASWGIDYAFGAARS